MDSNITPEVAEAAWTLDPYHAAVEEGEECGTCGEPFEDGQQMLHVYSPWFDTANFRAVENIHLRCYQGEEVLRD